MKPYYIKATSKFDHSVVIRRDMIPYNNKDYWHFHDEYELVYIKKGKGKRFVGDHMSIFDDGDLVFLGSMVPHLWLNSESYVEGGLEVETYVMHIQRRFFDNDFFNLPSLSSVKELIVNANRGISIQQFPAIEHHLDGILMNCGGVKVARLIELLSEMADHKHINQLASSGFVLNVQSTQDERLNVVLNHISHHFSDHICVSELATKVNMSLPAFSAYFRKKTRRTVTQYINEYRIGYAKKLLLKSDLSVSQIGYKCGYNNLSFFNRKFKETEGITPLQFRKRIMRS